MQKRFIISFLGLIVIVLGDSLWTVAQLPVGQSYQEHNWQRLDTGGKNHYQSSVMDGMALEEKQQRVRTLYASTLGRLWLDGSRMNGVQLAADTIMQAGMLWADFDFKHGALHLPQQAYNQKQVSVGTWGFKNLGRVKAGGNFSYSRTWEDSLSANLTGRADGITPYYYFTPKAGTFEREIYKMGMALSYDVIKDHLFLGADINYLHNISSGSVDPRPMDIYMNVDFRPSLIYKRGSTFVGASIIKGYGNEDMSISYKSSLYNLGNAYPERNYYLNMGYGSLILKSTVVKENLLDNQGLALNLSTSWQGYTFRGGLQYQKHYMDSRRSPDTLLATDNLARWSLNEYIGWFQFKNNKMSGTSLWQLYWQRQKGHDSNIIFGGRNYFAINNRVDLSFLSLKNKGALQWEFGLTGSYQESERTDVLAAHYLHWQSLEATLTGGFYIAAHNGNLWKLIYKPHVTVPLSLSATLPPTQQNVFSENIFYPEISYRSQLLMENNVTIGFDSPYLIPNLYCGFSLAGGWINRLSTNKFDQVQIPGPILPTVGSFLTLRLAFNLYL